MFKGVVAREFPSTAVRFEQCLFSLFPTPTIKHSFSLKLRWQKYFCGCKMNENLRNVSITPEKVVHIECLFISVLTVLLLGMSCNTCII